MRYGARCIALSLVFGSLLVAMRIAQAQTVFTYTANDYRTVTMAGPGTTTIAVNTLVIIQAGPSRQQPQVATQPFIVRFRPPEAADPRILQASVDNQPVNFNITRSDFDGEMEATVDVPVTLGESPNLKLLWSTKSAGVLEMTLAPTLIPETPSEHPRLHAAVQAKKPSTLVAVKAAKGAPKGLRTVFVY